MFRRRTLMLIMGQRAERLHRERERGQAVMSLHKKANSLNRSRASLNRKLPPILKHQEARVKNLEKDETEHKLDLKVSSSDHFKRQDKNGIKRVKNFISQVDQHQHDINEIHKELEVLRKHIKDAEEEMQVTKHAIAARIEECSRFRVATPDKVLRRYDLACQNFGMQLQENKELLATLHDLRKDKLLIMSTYRELIGDLRRMSRELAAHVKVAQETHDNQVTMSKTLARINEHFHKSANAYQSDMNDFECKIDELKRRERFVTQKNKVRFDASKEWRDWLAKQLSPNEEEVIKYQRASNRACDVLGKAGLMEIVDTFVHLKEENYLLFCNVSEVKERVQEHLDEIGCTQQKLSDLRSEEARALRESKMQKKELENKRDEYQSLSDDKELEIAVADGKIDMYIKGVLGILRRLGYTKSEITQLAGVYGKAEERNLNVFLGHLEAYVGKLWDLQVYTEFTRWDERRKMSVTKPPVQAYPPRLTLSPLHTIVPPNDEESIEDRRGTDDSRPVQLPELKRQVNHELNTRRLSEPASKHRPVSTLQDLGQNDVF